MPFEFSPQKLVYGGEALGHAKGRTVLVPHSLPGERLEVETVRDAKGVVHARPLRILEAAPERVSPPCPYFGRCGGCHYQHLAIEHQAHWKLKIVRETLQRIGKISWDREIRVHQASPWNYRNQAQLKVAETEFGEIALGFFAGESHQLIPIDECLILSPRLNHVLGKLRRPEWVSRLRGCREVELLADDRDEQVRIVFHENPGASGHEVLAEDLIREMDAVVTVVFHNGPNPRVFGQQEFIYHVGEYMYQVSAGAFFQSSRYLLPELVKAVTESSPEDLALDLYAGVGLFTLPLARRFRQVVGVESHPAAAGDLKINAARHGLKHVCAVGQRTSDFLRRFAQDRPDLVVLDPPRCGAEKSTLKYLVDLRPRRIHYVACHPPTWARDLSYLLSRNYRLEDVEMFDCFPHTYHIECLARLVCEGPTA
ncbi:MAG TPA: 23S rRNA (uracil(1939)-C(5))-methyltransferase RlmD [Terriglobia bacterium]|nr:23S rRNA (uracil(1939)-C(5))-methyltransferase RlmD [Terriglobia bacterium]